LINECAGYTSKYYEEIGAQKMTYSEMVQKYRPEREHAAESDLLGDKHPHCLLVCEGAELLYRM